MSCTGDSSSLRLSHATVRLTMSVFETLPTYFEVGAVLAALSTGVVGALMGTRRNRSQEGPRGDASGDLVALLQFDGPVARIISLLESLARESIELRKVVERREESFSELINELRRANDISTRRIELDNSHRHEIERLV